MYISVKWKAVIFISVVVLATTALWTWQIVVEQLSNFENKLRQDHSMQGALLSEILDDNFVQLSQFAQLISARQVIAESLDTDPGRAVLKESLERDWLSYSINLGFDYLGVFDGGLNSIAEIASPELLNEEHFHSALAQELKESSQKNQPRNLIFCSRTCMQVVLEPFINDQGRLGTLALAQNMADVVRGFYEFTGSELGILIEKNPATENQKSSRYLDAWSMQAWAVSHFKTTFPVIREFADHYAGIANDDFSLIDIEGRRYLVKELPYGNLQRLGMPIRFASVMDKTEEYQVMRNNIERGILAGFFGWLCAEAILLLVVSREMRRLSNVVDALYLLPQQQFKKAIERVSSRRKVFRDELTNLEESTREVATELDALHREISVKNESLKQQVDALTRSRGFLTRLFDNSQIFIITQDFRFNILSSNKKFESLYTKTPRSFESLIRDENEFETFSLNIDDLRRHKVDAFQQELNLLHKENESLIITWNHALVEDERGNEIVLSIGMDQTQQKNAENDLRWMANHDSLTSIGNRRSFNRAFEELLVARVSGALIFIDVNRFKQINDVYGHNVGDQVLVDIATALRELTRSSDIISRFAGDEFTCLLPNIDNSDITSVLSKITNGLNGTLRVDIGKVIHYSVSVGAALYPEHGKDPQTLVVNADMAMYHAKKKGLGHWHLYDAADERVTQVKNDYRLIMTITNALKTGSFELLYQPILDIADNSICHYEVLLRMYDESGGVVSPGLFIPIAEKSGEIRNIDEWVLDNAMRSLRMLLDRSIEVNFAVNISAPTLQANDFPELVLSIIGKYRIDPERIIIELTETAYIENFQQVLKNLSVITDAGVRVALDDFGVGFSSFTYLKKLPLSYVKLDGSYIRHLTDNLDDQVFVKSLAAMITAFGMETIAEFVEDEATLTMIEKLGVTHGQGYYIGKPGPISSISIPRVKPLSSGDRYG